MTWVRLWRRISGVDGRCVMVMVGEANAGYARYTRSLLSFSG
jgi:hypothetical protein